MYKKSLIISLLMFSFLTGCNHSKTDPVNPNIPDHNDQDTPNNPDHNDNENNNPDSHEGSVKDLTIYSLNDTHGDLLKDPDIENFGIDGISYFMQKETKAKNYDDVVYLCTGDMFQGQYVSNTTRGRAIVDALNYLNLDAFVLGNHEFDWGLDQIKLFKDGIEENGELNCDILCANLIYKPTNSTPDWIKPYTIVEKAGHKVGIIGFMGENLESSILAEMVKDYEFVETKDLALKYAKELREEKGCDSVVIGIHDYDTNLFREYAKLETPVDVIFGGHTHRFELHDYVRSYDNKTIYSVQSGANNEGFSVANLTFNNDKSLKETKVYSVSNYGLSDEIDFNLKGLIEEKYKNEIAASNEIISNNFRQKTRREWGYFVARTMVGEFSEGANLSCINTGGIRNSTDYEHESSILYAKQLFRVLPFDNKIYQVKIPKAPVDRLIDSGDRYHYRGSNSKIQTGDYYILNVIDYVFDGKYNRDVFNQGQILKTFDLNIREYVTKSIKR